jgi:hypothetical protein
MPCDITQENAKDKNENTAAHLRFILYLDEGLTL